MSSDQATWRWLLAGAAVLLLILAARPLVALHQNQAGVLALTTLEAGANASGGGAPNLTRRLHRNLTRAEHSLVRFARLFRQVGLLWLSIILSTVVFLAVAALSSVADFRIFDLRRHGPGAVSRYLGRGTHTFFRILLDRRTPYTARALLAAGLLYWLLPIDLIGDTPIVPGYVDDVVVAVLAAKGFLYLCPDAIVIAHAAAVQPQGPTLWST